MGRGLGLMRRAGVESHEGASDQATTGRSRRWWATRIGIPVAVGAIALGVGIGAAASGGGDSETATTPTGTDAVTKQTLVDRETFDGTLGYDDARQVVNQFSGTITSVRAEGATVTRGKLLYRVDNSPVVLMYGATPAYRDLDWGDEGQDVTQLEQNLAALGYDAGGDLDIDGEFDSATAEAVRDWQSDLGLSETGRVELGRVVFQDGARRIAGRRVTEGGRAAPGQAVLDTTSVARSVTVELDARRQDLARVDSRQRVTLPSGKRVNARITEVGTVAKAASDDAAPTVTVTLRLETTAGVSSLDQAPVDVEITKETKKDVLTVPVTALLALAGGGHGIEVVEASGERRIVAVETGLFADGRVEITGGGVGEGTKVVVPV